MKRHATSPSNVPYTTLTLEAVLRAVLECTTLDEAVLEEVRGVGREQLVHEYRRLCITGFRLTTGRGVQSVTAHPGPGS